MLKQIGETFSKAAGNLSKNLSGLLDIGTAAQDPKSFMVKKGLEALFSRGFGGGQDMGLVDTSVTPPRYDKSIGFYTPSKARSSGTMGIQGKVVDADTLNRLWLARLREYQKYTKFYT